MVSSVTVRCDDMLDLVLRLDSSPIYKLHTLCLCCGGDCCRHFVYGLEYVTISTDMQYDCICDNAL